MGDYNSSKDMSAFNGHRDLIRNYKKKITEEDLILFVSFDLVNSSIYKSMNYLNWFKVLYVIIKRIQDEMTYTNENFEIWRTIGDEVIFVKRIINSKQLKESVANTFKIMNDIVCKIKDGEIFRDYNRLSEDKNELDYMFDDDDIEGIVEQDILSIKAAAWIATVSNEKNNNSKVSNIKYTYPVENGSAVEFQGNDIDTGFRIAKCNTMNRRFALSVELAYILSEDNLVNSNIYVISYNRLKGVWNERLYPVIWYHDRTVTKCSLEESFYYDDDESSDLVHEYINKDGTKIRNKTTGNAYAELAKLIKDRNLETKIKKIKSKISNLGTNIKNNSVVKVNNRLEVHCVAVCYNPIINKVLMFKRTDDGSKYSGKWDFGCAKIQTSLSFSEQLTKDYKKIANIEIKVYEPFKEYSFFRDDNNLISGIRFFAIVDINENDIGKKIRMNKEKYELARYFSLDNLRELPKEQFVEYDEFVEVVEEVCKRFGEKEIR